MEYPPVKPHHKALHELRKEFIYEKYRESFKHIMELAGNDTFAQLEVYDEYFQVYSLTGNPEEASQLIQKMRNILADGTRETVLQLIVEARYDRSQNDITASETKVDLALSLLEDKNCDVYVLTLYQKAVILVQSLKFEAAIKLYREIIQSDYNLMIASSVTNALGNVNKTLGKLEEARSYYEQALRLFQQLGYIRDIAGCYNNLGAIAGTSASEEDQHEKIKYYLEALELISRTSDTVYKCNILTNLATTYRAGGHMSEALAYAEEAVSIARQAKSPSSIATTTLCLGDTLGLMGRDEEALCLLEECIPYVYSLESENILILYEDLCAACSELGLSEKGFQYAQRLYELKREYDKQEKNAIVYHNRVLMEEAYRHENEMQELKLKSVEEKVRLQAAQLVSQTEVLSKFRDGIREIARQYPSNDPGWRAVKEKLKELPCKQIDWEKFEAEFKAVHPEFTQKLYDQYPSLTPSEVKLCSLLRLNLKSHEIARLFCLSERSVETHRFNIRKKMNIGREQNLVNFLNTL